MSVAPTLFGHEHAEAPEHFQELISRIAEDHDLLIDFQARLQHLEAVCDQYLLGRSSHGIPAASAPCAENAVSIDDLFLFDTEALSNFAQGHNKQDFGTGSHNCTEHAALADVGVQARLAEPLGYDDESQHDRSEMQQPPENLAEAKSARCSQADVVEVEAIITPRRADADGVHRQRMWLPYMQQRAAPNCDHENFRDAMDMDRQWTSFSEEVYKYALKESIWDATVFIPDIGCGGATLVAISLVLNFLIQIAYCTIVLYNLCENPFTEEDIAGLRLWRATVAHDERRKTPVTFDKLSLAQRVCEGDLTLEVGTDQVMMLETVWRYLPGLGDSRKVEVHGELHTWLQGHIMCLLALCCWYLNCSLEVSSALDFGRGFLRLPHGRHELVWSENGGLVFAAISPIRKVLITAVFLARMAMAFYLLYTGSLFLINTESMEDLLLNSLALDLVLTLDELIFEALAPDSARIFIAQVAPVCTGALPSWRGADAKAVALPISIALLMAASWFGFLQQMVESLKQANEVMCGGELDFTYKLDAFDVVHVNNQGFREWSEDYSLPHYAQAVLDFAHGSLEKSLLAESGADSWQYQVKDDLLDQVNEIYAFRNLGCHDALDLEDWKFSVDWNLTEAGIEVERTQTVKVLQQRNVWLDKLHFLMGKLKESEAYQHITMPTNPSCKDLYDLVADIVRAADTDSLYALYELTTLRNVLAITEPGVQVYLMKFWSMAAALCPVTNGCNSLIRGSMENYDSVCPQTCLLSPDESETWTTPCIDADVSDENSDRGVTLKHWRDYTRVWGGSWGELAPGCQIISDAWGSKLCESTTIDSSIYLLARPPFEGHTTARPVFKVWTYLCPVACGCKSVNNVSDQPHHCPKTCGM